MRDRACRLLLAAVLSLLAGCSGGAAPAGTEVPVGLRIMVPNSAGSGYDLTARTIAGTLRETGLRPEVSVFNLVGGTGMSGLGRLMGEHGNDRLLMQMGLGIVGATLTHQPPYTVAEATPLARLLGEPQAVMVPADSGYTELDELIDDWTAAPESIRVGGGSQPGGPDHLTAMLLAEAVGIPPPQVDYVSYDGGGELVAAVLTGEVDIATAGTRQHRHLIDAGQLRVLAVSGAEPLESVDAPTLVDSGIALTFLNWRGLVAPPGIGEAERRELEAMLAEMRATPAWEEVMAANGWQDAYLSGEDFTRFLRAEHDRVAALLRELEVAPEGL